MPLGSWPILARLRPMGTSFGSAMAASVATVAAAIWHAQEGRGLSMRSVFLGRGLLCALVEFVPLPVIRSLRGISWHFFRLAVNPPEVINHNGT